MRPGVPSGPGGLRGLAWVFLYKLALFLGFGSGLGPLALLFCRWPMVGAPPLAFACFCILLDSPLQSVLAPVVTGSSRGCMAQGPRVCAYQVRLPLVSGVNNVNTQNQGPLVSGVNNVHGWGIVVTIFWLK